MPTLSPAEIQSLVNKNMGPLSAEEKRIMVAIALAESGGKTDAVNRNTNGSTDIGLWQINSVHDNEPIFRGKDRKDPTVNAGLAALIYLKAGKKFTPWVAYKNGAYKKFLDKVPAQGDIDAAKDTLDTPSGLETVTGSNPVTDAINSVNEQINKVASSAGAWVIAILFAVMGLVLILRQPAMKIAKTAIGTTAVGKVAKGAGL